VNALASDFFHCRQKNKTAEMNHAPIINPSALTSTSALLDDSFSHPPIDESSELFLDDLNMNSNVLSDESSLNLLNSEEGDQLDDIVASALHQMTLEDREKLYYDQHGVADIIEETPEFVEKRLEDLQHHLKRFKSKRSLPTAAISLAESKDPAVVRNPKIALRFLRAERFHAKKAAIRMIRYYDLKLWLFGESKLCKRIVQEDLGQDDIKALKRGIVQGLPSRDRAGRVVFVFFPSHLEDTTPDTLVSIWISWGSIPFSRDDSSHTRVSIFKRHVYSSI
jgi:hypothetical protein